MKAIAINGVSKSGKTTICETIIAGLCKRGYTVGSVKEIHFEQFAIDPNPNTNTNRHKNAGSQLVTARGMAETDILYQSKLSMGEILKHYDYDYVILEGVSDYNVPRIITAHCESEVAERIDARAVLVSGVYANDNSGKCCDLPIINALTEGEKLVDFVEKTAKKLENIREEIELLVDGKSIDMVPFVQKILKNTVMGVVSEMRDTEAKNEVVVRIKI